LDQKTATALSKMLSPHVSLSKDRRETLAFLTVGMLSARTANLSVLATERPGPALVSSTYRRLQRFFQFAELGEDWAAPVAAGLLGLNGPLTLVLDRTNWKVGRRHVNLLVLAVATRRHRVGLMWTVLDRAGNSGAKERIALIERFIVVFGKARIGLLLGDREFIGTEWLNYQARYSLRDPYAGGAPGHHRRGPFGDPRPPARRAGRTTPRHRHATVTLDVMARGGVPGPEIAVRAVRPAGREPVIVATNRPDLRALDAYRKRWAIECFFADAKTRGLNLEDTRLTAPRKLDLLVAVLVIAIAWASATADRLLGRTAPPRKKHGYPAKSRFRTGLDRLRRQISAASPQAFAPWNALNETLDKLRVV
jgi:hypothetical protein